jgi:DNA-binding MarR family transcriptional regulator
LSKASTDPTFDADLARLLLGATRAFEREMLVRLAHAGLDMLAPRHLTVLRALDAGPGARASAIARDARVTRQAVAQAVAELEQLGILEQAPDPTDARAKLVRYTTFGLDGYRRALAVFTALEREHVQLLGPARVAALKQDLRSLAEIGTRDSSGAAR